MDINSKIYVAGHGGMVGSAIVRALNAKGYRHVIGRTSAELDLRNQQQCNAFFAAEKPDYAVVAAAKVGGILANSTYPAQFLYDNLLIAANTIQAAHANKVRKLLFLGSSCIYPKYAPQPIKEEYLLAGALEPTNEAYAVAKIAGIQLCRFYRREHGCNFISAMPTNLYGTHDNFNLESSHVLPALIRRFHDAKTSRSTAVTLWGTGTPRREFLYVDDLADACIFLMNHYDGEQHINVGTGEDIQISELAAMVKDIVGYGGSINYDTTKPDGTPRKLLDVSLLHGLGWKHTTPLDAGIRRVYQWYTANC